MYSLGIDVGSSSCKAVLLGNGRYEYVITRTGWSPRQAGEEAYEMLLSKVGIDPNLIGYRVATGYGRISLDFVDETVTEVTCHARGAKHLFSSVDLVIDVGGQDSKVIAVDSRGRVVDFMLNDKCAAGTGKFLEVMAHALELDPSQMGEIGIQDDPVPVSSMCTVFAQTEVIGLLAKGISKKRIIAGVHRSIAQRVASMVARLGEFAAVAFVGGVAKNLGVRNELGQLLGTEVLVPAEPQIVGALGAALIGSERIPN